MIFVPLSAACFMRAPTTGCAWVGFAPITISTSDCSMSSNEPEQPLRPTDLRRPYDVGEWQTREQLSMLLVPIAARNTRCIAQPSSLVARAEASPAIASGPCSALMRVRSKVMRSSASSQEARRSSPFSRTSGAVSRSRERVNWCAKRPFTQVWPLLAGPSAAGETATTWSPTACASRRQPTPQ